MRGPRGGQGSLERPVQPGQWYAEVARVGKGPVCSCIASEHTNPDSGHAVGILMCGQGDHANLYRGRSQLGFASGCTYLLHRRGAAPCLNPALGVLGMLWVGGTASPSRAPWATEWASRGGCSQSQAWWQPASVLHRAGQPSKPCSRLAH